MDKNYKDSAITYNDIFTDVNLLARSEGGAVDLNVPDSEEPTVQERRATFAQLRRTFSALLDNVTKT